MNKYEDLSGLKFNSLTVIEPQIVNGKRQWLCICDCGKTIFVRSGHLKSGHTRSCGCQRKGRPSTHRLSHTPLYQIWSNMKYRCNNPKCKSYCYYGGRGIKVCSEWNNSFEIFRDWSFQNGYTDGLSLDRINNDKGYSPDNCQWIPLWQNTSKATKKHK